MTETMIRPAEGGEGGFAVCARILNAWFALDPPLDSRQIELWNRRRTRNRDGEPFPEPRVIEGAKPPQPSRLFSVRDVVAWYAAGVPDKYGVGWKGGESTSA
jgi:hypothetical protein